MKRLLTFLSFGLLLSACVDTTGISAASSKQPGGNPQAVVVVAEYADLECPACKAAHGLIIKPMLQKYGTQIRYEFRHFPLRSLHRNTMELAESAECAADQGKFWEYVDYAFEHQSELAKGKPTEWGIALVANDDLFQRCVDSHIKRDAIMAEYDAGVAANVRGTPTFFVGGKQTQSTIEDISAAIEEQLKGAGQRL